MKRLFDVVLSAVALALLFPVMLAVACISRILLGPGIFFTQERIGLHDRPFRIVKFRTMLNAVDASGQPLPDHIRLTRYGRILRATSLDELPGLWNVLIGDMSLVGPRPLLPKYLPRYSPLQRRRHDVRPGITGLAQVKGRNAVSWDERLAWDVVYVDHHSFGGDLKILLATVAVVLRRHGISAAGSATMTEFMGSEETVDPARQAMSSASERKGREGGGMVADGASKSAGVTSGI